MCMRNLPFLVAANASPLSILSTWAIILGFGFCSLFELKKSTAILKANSCSPSSVSNNPPVENEMVTLLYYSFNNNSILSYN